MNTTIEQIFAGMEYGPAPESDAPLREFLEQNNDEFGVFINGRMRRPGKKTFDVIAPATGEVLAQVTQASTRDVNDAVKAAEKAQPAWAALSGREKGDYLYALSRILGKKARDFQVIEAMDNGKPFRETRGADVALAIKHLEDHAHYAGMMDIHPEFKGRKAKGVVGQIIPWNFPLLMLVWKIAPALATGNTVVLKPSELTPLTALKFTELIREAGIPDGVINIVTGDKDVGEKIVRHEGTKKIAFTGSPVAGRAIRRATAGMGKSLTLELGGKSPFIVLADADLDAAVEGVVNAIFFNQGEVCCGGSRLLLQEGIEEKFIEKLKVRMAELRPGGPLDKSIDIGSVVSKTQFKRIDGFVQEAKEDGLEITQLWKPEDGADSCRYPPTLVTGANPANTIMQDEVFGPVLAAMTFRTPDEAIELANNTQYGLAASVWTEKMEHANYVASGIDAGVKLLNGVNQFDGSVPFGGRDQSGFGVEGGFEGLEAYLECPTDVHSNNDELVDRPPRTGQNFISVLDTPVDRTYKNLIGGKEVRGDGERSRNVISPGGVLLGQVYQGNRKDVRNALVASTAALATWGQKMTPYQRSQVLNYWREKMSGHRAALIELLNQSIDDNQARHLQGLTAEQEVDASLDALFNFAAWAAKFEGRVHIPASGGMVPTTNDPIGVVGIVAPNVNPLLSFTTMTAAALAGGNTIVAVPSEWTPLPATRLVDIWRTSDFPPGAVNLITGDRDELAGALANHNGVKAIWYHGSEEGSEMVERTTGSGDNNLKRSWVNNGTSRNWKKLSTTDSMAVMRRATTPGSTWGWGGAKIG